MNNDSSKNTPSRSAKKRESLALQNLGAELAALAPEQVAKLDLPRDLVEAIELFQRINDKEGRRRQMQYIGRLMRETDPAPIRKALDEIRDVRAKDIGLFKQTEEWRRKFLSCGQNEIGPLVKQLLASHPANVTQPEAEIEVKLLDAINRARLENTGGKKSGPTHYRVLFRLLSSILNTSE